MFSIAPWVKLGRETKSHCDRVITITDGKLCAGITPTPHVIIAASIGKTALAGMPNLNKGTHVP